MRKIISVLVACVISISIICVLCSCGKSSDTGSDNTVNETENASSDVKTENIPSDAKNPVVTIEMENGGTITAELYYNKAPNSVKNFISLINKGFYDGVIFHRVIPGFVIQGGDPEGTGMGGPGYTIKGEFPSNDFDNDAKHLRGALSMARGAYSFDSAGSQFFICVADRPDLDGNYAVFGQVVDGMDIVDEIVSSERDQNDKPLKDNVIKKVTVDTFGVEYGEPEKIS